MKQNLSKVLAVLSASALMLAGCSSGSSGTPSQSGAPSSDAPSASAPAAEPSSESSAPPAAENSVPTEPENMSQEEAIASGAYHCSDEPVELSAHLHWGDVYVLSDQWTVEDQAAKITNVKLKGTASPMEGDSQQAFNLMIASKNIPDLVGGKRDDINKYGMQGAFMPLNDLLDQYAPHIKKVLDENPDVLGAITAADGNIYQIPFLYENLVSEGWFIRQDWLDKVNKPVPTTVDELHDVLTAFVNEDPNGNGKKDEVGIFTRLQSSGETNTLLSVLSLFGVNDYWHLGKDGKAALGLYTPEYKEAIKQASQWYAEGLIDKEIFTRGGKSRDMLFPENNGGVIHDWIPSTSGYNPKMKDVVPGFKLVGMLPPTDSNGDRWEVASRDKLSGAGWAMSAENKSPEITMKYMDFWWTEMGRTLTTYGVEGDTFTMVDGEPAYTEKVLGASTPINDFMRKIGGQIEDMASLHDASYEKFMMDEEGAKTAQMYDESGLVNTLYPKIPALSFTEEELNTIKSKYPPCRTYMLEQLQKWTFDGSTIDAEFDGYLSTLQSMGMDEIVGIYQTAYDRLMGN